MSGFEQCRTVQQWMTFLHYNETGLLKQILTNTWILTVLSTYLLTVLQPANGCNSNLESEGQILIPLKLNRIMLQEKDMLISGKEKFHWLSKIHLSLHACFYCIMCYSFKQVFLGPVFNEIVLWETPLYLVQKLQQYLVSLYLSI